LNLWVIINMASDFVKVKCGKCKNVQTIFTKASTRIECLVCGEILAEPTGGKADIKATIVK